MKSDLQIHAERAAQQFTTVPYLPKPLRFPDRGGCRARLGLSDQDKKHANFSVWTAATALAQVLEKTGEFQEELRLNVEPETLRIVGAVYLQAGGSRSKHVSVAYEWRAKTNDDDTYDFTPLLF